MFFKSDQNIPKMTKYVVSTSDKKQLLFFK
jgi:hypothetical protein